MLRLLGHLKLCFKESCCLLKRNELKLFCHSIWIFVNYLLFNAWLVLKWTQWILREKLNSMNLLMYMAPVAVAFLLPAALIMEEDVVGITIALARDDSNILWLLIFNSALAYFVNLTNFLVTKHTSALTLQVIISLPLPIKFWEFLKWLICHYWW